MINLLKALVILTLLGAIAGGGAAAYYFLIERPRQLDAAEISVVHSGQPTPDPSTPDFEKVQAFRRDQNYAETRAALETFLLRYPDSSHHDAVETMLGDVNRSELFARQGGTGKIEYVVQPGDVLDRVARKTKSDPELLFMVNGLERTMLRVGQRLEIPQVDFAVEARIDPRRLVLLDHGKFFKSYKLLDARPLAKKVTEIRTKVQEKLAYQENRRVVFGSKEYPTSLRSLSLAGQPGYTIYARAEGVPGGDKPLGSGLGLDPADAEELHALVSVGTPVTIRTK